MAGMKPRHAAALTLVVTRYLMAPPNMREDSWSCSGGLLATLSHDLFGTGDQKLCEQWEKIADLNSPSQSGMRWARSRLSVLARKLGTDTRLYRALSRRMWRSVLQPAIRASRDGDGR
jgi:hypothetical protein